MLNLPAVLTGVTGMDQYGFFTLDPVAGRPWPLLLSLALGSASAGAGYLAYRLLRRRAWFVGNRYEAYHHNAVVFGTPVAVAFLPVFFLTGYDNKPLVVGVAGIMATSLCLIAALNDHKIRIDAAMARALFVVGAAIILVLLALSVSGMLAMYFIEHSPSGGNFFWTWEFAWSDLGYPAEEFSQRHRNGLLAFGVAGTVYMTVALGAPLLGEVLSLSQRKPGKGAVPVTAAAALSEQPETFPDLPDAVEAQSQDPPEFVAVLDGREEEIDRGHYENLLAEKDRLLPDTKLLVDKISGDVFAKVGGSWRKIVFRKRQAPFQLLCVYARHPGRRFTVQELEALLWMELPERSDFNVNDLLAQLQRKPHVPVERDEDGSYIPESVRVCFLDYQPCPANDSPTPDVSMPASLS